MQRCISLASAGLGKVAPNPMVGAVLVYGEEVLGEGYHEKYGEAHAEVNAINAAIAAGHESKLPGSTMYVSLEPCAHFGKTPPCTDLVIKHKIPRVVVGCRDPFEKVNGKGIEKLIKAGVDVVVGVLEKECRLSNRRFFTSEEKKRPYVILKWAQTRDGIIGNSPAGEGNAAGRLYITNEAANRLVHKWRSEEMSIMVGTNTALRDDPQLTTRLWAGASPIRMVVDLDLKLPLSLKIFDGETKTVIFNAVRSEEKGRLLFCKVSRNEDLIPQVLKALHELRIQSVLVEGGALLLQSFIDAGVWDEARVITNKALVAGEGIHAPVLKDHTLSVNADLVHDHLQVFTPSNQ